MGVELFEVVASNGVVIHGRRWMPAGVPRAIVQIAHGMAEHSARYEWFAGVLTGAGYAVYASDHRGHGRTADAGTLGHFGAPDGWASVVEDLHGVAQRARADVPGAPFVLLGHSMGSLLARSYAARYGAQMSGLVLSGTPADAGVLGRVGRVVARVEGRIRGAKHPSKLLDTMSFGAFNRAFKPARTDFDWLSRDAAQVDAYVDDPLCGFVCSDGFYADMLGVLTSVNTMEVAGRVPSSMPILVVSGDADPAGKNGSGVRAAAELLRKAGSQDVTVTLYAGARHEILNETNRDEVAADIVAWLDSHITL